MLVAVFHFLGFFFFHIYIVLLNFIIRRTIFWSIMTNFLTIVALNLGFVVLGFWVASCMTSCTSLIIVIEIIFAKIPISSTTESSTLSSTPASTSRPLSSSIALTCCLLLDLHLEKLLIEPLLLLVLLFIGLQRTLKLLDCQGLQVFRFFNHHNNVPKSWKQGACIFSMILTSFSFWSFLFNWFETTRAVEK